MRPALHPLLPALLLTLAPPPAPGAAQAAGTSFTAPDRTFSLVVPAGWRTRTDPSPQGPITWIMNGAATVSVMGGRVPVQHATPQQRARFLEEVSRPFFEGWLAALKDRARVQARPVARTQLFGWPALRLDVSYRRGDGHDPHAGYAVYVLTGDSGYFVTAVAGAGALPAADRVVASIRPGGGR